MSEYRVTELPEATSLSNDDVIMIDSLANGVKKIKANRVGNQYYTTEFYDTLIAHENDDNGLDMRGQIVEEED